MLKREEIFFEISDFNSTPSRKEIMEKIVSETNSKPEMVVIDGIKQWFGLKKLRGTARVYEDMDTLKKIEEKFLVDRTEGQTAKEKKGAESSAK